jgi:hypothetical protein
MFDASLGAGKEELIMVMLSTLSPHGIVAAESNLLWINILMVAIIAAAAVAALVALKKS